MSIYKLQRTESVLDYAVTQGNKGSVYGEKNQNQILGPSCWESFLFRVCTFCMWMHWFSLGTPASWPSQKTRLFLVLVYECVFIWLFSLWVCVSLWWTPPLTKWPLDPQPCKDKKVEKTTYTHRATHLYKCVYSKTFHYMTIVKFLLLILLHFIIII